MPGSPFVVSDYLEDRFKLVAGLLKWCSGALFLIVILGALQNFKREYRAMKLSINSTLPETPTAEG
jgi:hypothetical protein